MTEIRNISPRLKVTSRPARSRDEIDAKTWEEVEILYTDHVLPNPESVPNLCWIQFHHAGIETHIPDPIFDSGEVQATTLSGANASQVAEYVLTMILALGRQIPVLKALQEARDWPEDRWKRLRPQELRTSTVGIVGYGSVGRQVARLLNTFGATVLATKRDAMNPEDSGYYPKDLGDPAGDLVHRLYPPQALRSMLKECDFIVITVPLTYETRGIIGPQEFQAVKASAYLIDISRGEVLDHEALVEALEKGKLAGAALDVFPEEPLPSDSPLWGLPNVILSPHISGITAHYDERAVALFSENLYRYLADQPLYNQINLERGY